MPGARSRLRYRPLNLARWLIWGLTALVMAVLPQLFTQGFALTLMSQMGVAIIFALSYNMLLGQSGMLSFGHAVYSGLGAYVAVHTLNLASKGQIWMPVSLLPLVGGLAGAFFGVLFGYVTTKRAGTTFAMITLGIGELVFSCSLMFPDFFGGEGGVTTNRVFGEPFLGITFGPRVQVYYLIAVWCLLSMALMYAWAHTPLGRIANAVRDNPERAEFVGYDTQRVRWFTLIISAFFAGIAGALGVINFEIVTAENVSAVRSGGVLLAAFIGGVGFFRPDHRRLRVSILRRRPVRLHSGLAVVPPVLHAHGDVCTRRHRQPGNDAGAAGRAQALRAHRPTLPWRRRKRPAGARRTDPHGRDDLQDLGR